MRRIGGIGLAITLGTGLVGSATGAQEANEPVTWYAQALIRSEGALQVTYYWSKGRKLRVETVIGWHRVVNLVNGDTYYAYDVPTQRGVAIQRAKTALADDASGARPFGQELELLLAQGAEAVGTETIMGAPCDLYRVTDRAGKREVCVSPDEYRLPRRTENYLRATGVKFYTDYVDWLRGAPIPDSFFEPEAGIQLEHYTLEEFLIKSAREGAQSPAPLMFNDLLHGRAGVTDRD